RPLVPIGGGKDSAAVLGLLPGATGISISATAIQRRLAAAAGVELLEVDRVIDRNLFRLTPSGYNGHIPITAINSALSSLVAYLFGFDCVVMGNERSASEPTRTVGGVPVNHQYSKSFEFEAVLHDAIALSGVDYFSVLRQLSELSIAGIVARDLRLRGSFLSCNRAFVRSRDPDAAQVWCLECPKCLFTFLCFAPWLTMAEAEDIFGGNPLDNPGRTEPFRDLWRPESKPFDCVGERMESAVAMSLLARRPGWRETAVVRALAAEAGAEAAALGADETGVLAVTGPHLIPDALLSLIATAARR
ncbi:MAG: UDP-N-acetyl-alpha-D-muramoyl-L-alanyl-L-glutamate epimerase, partial [Actinomycetota bacterium]|nr:UDP-N-acetyl-alpha-D-muramoyl-L-alanyl-L-glutamate epimerase [Actinomycetota bacterium]